MNKKEFKDRYNNYKELFFSKKKKKKKKKKKPWFFSQKFPLIYWLEKKKIK